MADVAQSTKIRLSEEMVGKCLSMIKSYKASGPDSLLERVLKAC